MMEETSKSRHNRYMKKLRGLLFKVTLILAIPAFLAYFAGQYIDNRFDIYPYGTVVTSFVGLAFTWFILIRMLLNTNKESKEVYSEDKED